MAEYPAIVRIYTNQPVIRCLGTLIGLGFLAIGAYAMLGGGDMVESSALQRAWWFGITALIGGVWAIGVSWLDSDLYGVWCRPPRRLR
jgi:hypothetical protein